MIIGMELVGSAKIEVRQRVQNNFPAGRREGEGALGTGDGLVMRTPVAEMEGQKERDLSLPMRVFEGRCKSLGLTQTRQDTPKGARRKERIAQGEPEVDGLLARDMLRR
jgi:hypothetical protein